MTQDNTELLPVTQEDIAIALEHLGYDSVDDLHYWAENDTELRRFDELCSRFARHRLNTRTNQGHDALVKAASALIEYAKQGRGVTAELLNNLQDAIEALTNLPSPQAEAAPDDGQFAEAFALNLNVVQGYGDCPIGDIPREAIEQALSVATALRARPSGDVVESKGV